MKTSPMRHQVTALDRAALGNNFAFFMEQGTGKTWTNLAEAELLFEQNKIQCLIIVALNGVHRNWTEREVPTHLSCEHECFTWRASQTKKFHAALQAFAKPSPGRLKIFSINVETFSNSTSLGTRVTKYLLKHYACMMTLDESDTIKSPSAKRTRVLWNLGAFAQYRRVLTGTPITQSPFNAYAQFKFLSPQLLGFKLYAAFKNYYAIWKDVPLKTKGPGGITRTFPKIVRYRNLDHLKRNIDRHSFTVRKADCLDLPEKVYQERPVEMTPQQAALFKAARKQLIIELEDGKLTIVHAFTRLIRLAQIAGGFIAADDKADPIPIAGTNAKIESMRAYIEDLPTDVKIIVWCRFRHECALVAQEFKELGVLRYWGDVDDEERTESVNLFQQGDEHRLFVGTTSAGARGLTLTRASQVIYYSNSQSVAQRLQSEDRPHRIGQRNTVTYTDLIASGTTDAGILRNLREHKALADLFKESGVQGLIEWLKQGDKHED